MTNTTNFRFGMFPGALVAALAALACGGANTKNAGKGDTAAAQRVAPDTSNARVKQADVARIMGDSSAKVWMIMISDFQCPYCKEWHDSTMPELVRDYVRTGKVRLAYVNLPIRSHMNAVPAAEAAMCAGAQGKFWDYGDQLFATQQEWALQTQPRPTFMRLARTTALDTAQFDMCLSSDMMVPMLQADRQRAQSAGAQGTPTFLIGTRVIDQAFPASYFRPVLDSAVAAANKPAGRDR